MSREVTIRGNNGATLCCTNGDPSRSSMSEAADIYQFFHTSVPGSTFDMLKELCVIGRGNLMSGYNVREKWEAANLTFEKLEAQSKFASPATRSRRNSSRP